MAVLRKKYPDRHHIISLIEQALAEAVKTSILVKARCLVVAAASTAAAPSCLQDRVARSEPLREIELVPVEGGHNGDEEESRRFRITLIFFTGIGRGDGVPGDVFRLVLDLLMPTWDPLRRGTGGGGGQVMLG